MRSILRRGQSWVLVLAMIIVMAPAARAAKLPSAKNDAVRHEVCESLSTQAEAYYTGQYTWDTLSALEGDSSGKSLEGTKSELYKTLQQLMDDTMTYSITYNGSNGLQVYWPYTDTQRGYDNCTLFYSDVDSKDFNREHVWPKSRGSFYQSGAGADLHHLRPTNTNVNSTRGNMTMGNVVGVISNPKTYDYGGQTVLWYSPSDDLVEIRDEVKGDVARIFLYVYVRWGEPNLFENVDSKNLPPPYGGSDSGGNNGLKVMESLDTLLQWCEEDPVDQWEMARNDLTQQVQGNRNVFIDYPELAWLMFDREVPADMPTPSGEGGGSETPSFTITPASSNEAWGTVTLSGSRITAAPSEGYYASGAEVSPAGAATVTQSGNTFTVKNVTENCTVTVQFSQKTAAAVSYAVPEGVSVTNGPTAGYLGDEITLPPVSGAPTDDSQSYAFAGWVDAAVAATTDASGLEIYAPGGSYLLDEIQTKLYALYTYRVEDETGDPNTFKLVTANQADWSGDYVMTGGNEYVHLATGAGVGGANAAVALSGTGITKTDDTLTNVSGNYVISISRLPSGNYAMRLKGAPSDTYLSYPGSGNTLSSTDSSDGTDAQWTLSFNAGDCTLSIANVGTGGRYLRFNPSAEMFRCYTSGQENVRFYAAAGASTTYYLTLSGGDDPLPPDPPAPAASSASFAIAPAGFAAGISGAEDDAFMRQGVTLTGPDGTDTIAVTGTLAYKKGFTGFGSQSAGNFLGLRVTLPENTYDSAALTFSGKAVTPPDGGLYRDIIVRIDPASPSFTVAVDLDGEGKDYAPTTYTFDLTRLNLAEKPDDGGGSGGGNGGGSSGGGSSSSSVVRPDAIKESGTFVEVTLPSAGAKLNDAANEKVISLNKTKPIKLSGGGLTVTIPAGTLVKGADVNALLVNPGDKGNAIQVTLADGTKAILPLAVVGGGSAVYRATIAGTYQIVDNSKRFTDISEDHWAQEAVGFTASHELLKGTGDGSFQPTLPMTRAMIVTVLARIDGGEASADSTFADVSSSAWYSKDVAWAAENKIVEGDGNYFNPDALITREQLCAILVRYAEYSGLTLPDMAGSEGLSDADSVSPWAVDAVSAALKAGLLSGSTIAPREQVSRAEFAVFLQRFVEAVLK